MSDASWCTADQTIVRFVSVRTRETLLELKMMERSPITGGCAHRDRFESPDALGPVLRFAGEEIEFVAVVRVEIERVHPRRPLERETRRGRLKRR